MKKATTDEMIEGIIRDAAVQIEALFAERREQALRSLLAPVPKAKAPVAFAKAQPKRKGNYQTKPYSKAKRLAAVAAAARVGLAEASRRSGISAASIANWAEEYGKPPKKYVKAPSNSAPQPPA